MANKKSKNKVNKSKSKTANLRKRKKELYNVTYYNTLDMMKIKTAERNGRRKTIHKRLLKSQP